MLIGQVAWPQPPPATATLEAAKPVKPLTAAIAARKAATSSKSTGPGLAARRAAAAAVAVGVSEPEDADTVAQAVAAKLNCGLHDVFTSC